MQNQERRVKAEIKKVAREQQIDAARILAKDLARTRAHMSKMLSMRTQLQSLAMQMSSMKTQEAMTSAMGSAVGMMAKMNQQMNLPAMQQIAMQYEVEQGRMEVSAEMMDDAMDGIAGAEESDEADRILNEVLAEAGMADLEKLGTQTPMGMPQAQNQGVQQSQAPVDMSEIDAGLNNLR